VGRASATDGLHHVSKDMQAAPHCLHCPYCPLLPLRLTNWRQCIPNACKRNEVCMLASEVRCENGAGAVQAYPAVACDRS